MIVEHDPRRPGQNYSGDPYQGPPPGYRASALRRFLGGSPAGVFLRLLFLSVLVGAFMAMLGLTPARLFWQIYDAARALIDLGLATFHDFGGWILAGAVVVVPLWLISRLFAVSR
ncbi:DUF6460 domain-containing protein [Methylobacterium sp. E-041]|uniref:DUF6460 domain-containing protein n=1 Tax=unclassified Methylobacterium TaxID=2615210 RepID=UPI0011C7EE50|nr:MULTISPECIES: DUF6460 domain-containing protein [unclassified Methylobacterium]MCJ2008818.1 DUF6460 domain-containing protein [Methylobacterium sp. J-092]MCJ2038745.1 DUF6460 domain-containing protein [Methylobacterium sp. J-059]MCJ2078929.1 DUF6460 domain-containing protein [Methylobacterium sp. E-016]MCJ2109291.1 DUF6460 domain-containing protein [Methylobacterium sp. E-041]TXN54469.1 hypothetical protein FV230_28970 [Methylobacterium sp. WL6]